FLLIHLGLNEELIAAFFSLQYSFSIVNNTSFFYLYSFSNPLSSQFTRIILFDSPPGSLRFSVRELFLLILPLLPFCQICQSSRALCFFILTVFQKLPRLRTLSFFILTALYDFLDLRALSFFILTAIRHFINLRALYQLILPLIRFHYISRALSSNIFSLFSIFIKK